MVAPDNGQPRLLNLKQLLEIFVRHRREVVTRRTRYLLRKARERAHVLEGLSVALASIEEIIALIRRSPSAAEAKAGLMSPTCVPAPVTARLEPLAAALDLPAAPAQLADPGLRRPLT